MKEVNKCEGRQVLRGREDNFSTKWEARFPRAVRVQDIKLGIRMKGTFKKNLDPAGGG